MEKERPAAAKKVADATKPGLFRRAIGAVGRAIAAPFKAQPETIPGGAGASFRGGGGQADPAAADPAAADPSAAPPKLAPRTTSAVTSVVGAPKKTPPPEGPGPGGVTRRGPPPPGPAVSPPGPPARAGRTEPKPFKIHRAAGGELERVHQQAAGKRRQRDLALGPQAEKKPPSVSGTSLAQKTGVTAPTGAPPSVPTAAPSGAPQKTVPSGKLITKKKLELAPPGTPIGAVGKKQVPVQLAGAAGKQKPKTRTSAMLPPGQRLAPAETKKPGQKRVSTGPMGGEHPAVKAKREAGAGSLRTHARKLLAKPSQRAAPPPLPQRPNTLKSKTGAVVKRAKKNLPLAGKSLALASSIDLSRTLLVLETLTTAQN